MKIVIADDHDLVRDALATLLERDDPECQVLHADGFDRALNHIKENSDIDLVLLDINMPGMNQLESVKVGLEGFPEVKVVLMSGHVKRSEIEKGFDYGVHGYVSKSMNGSSLPSVLRLVCSGVRYVPELVLESDKQSAQKSNAISKREREVLVELAKGLSNKIIARNLNVEETTVKLHLRSIFKKLETMNRTETVVKARELGLLE